MEGLMVESTDANQLGSGTAESLDEPVVEGEQQEDFGKFNESLSDPAEGLNGHSEMENGDSSVGNPEEKNLDGIPNCENGPGVVAVDNDVGAQNSGTLEMTGMNGTGATEDSKQRDPVVGFDSAFSLEKEGEEKEHTNCDNKGNPVVATAELTEDGNQENEAVDSRLVETLRDDETDDEIEKSTEIIDHITTNDNFDHHDDGDTMGDSKNNTGEISEDYQDAFKTLQTQGTSDALAADEAESYHGEGSKESIQAIDVPEGTELPNDTVEVRPADESSDSLSLEEAAPDASQTVEDDNRGAETVESESSSAVREEVEPSEQSEKAPDASVGEKEEVAAASQIVNDSHKESQPAAALVEDSGINSDLRISKSAANDELTPTEPNMATEALVWGSEADPTRVSEITPDVTAAEAEIPAETGEEDRDIGGSSSYAEADKGTSDTVEPTSEDPAPVADVSSKHSEKDDFGDSLDEPIHEQRPAAGGISMEDSETGELANSGCVGEPSLVTTKAQDVGSEQVDSADDSFGDFGAVAAPAVSEENETQEPVNDDSAPKATDAHGLDEFESFNDQKQMGDTVIEGSGGESGKDNDEFGEFGAFNEPPSQDNNVEEENASGKELPDEEEEEFGDFGSFSEPNEVVENGLTRNDYGADAEPAVLQEDQSQEPVNDDDSAPNAAGEHGLGEGSGGGAKEENNDEFGDFGAFADPPSHDNNVAVEDASGKELHDGEEEEFGDFGSFNEPHDAVESELTKIGVTSSGAPTLSGDSSAVDDDEFGDFGDFSTAEQSIDAGVREPARAKAEAPSILSGEPSTANAKLVFSRVFSSYVSDNENNDKCEPTGAQVSVECILSSLPKGENRDDSCWSNETLETNLEHSVGVGDKPRVIVADNPVPAYSQFAFPLGGISGSEEEFREGTKKRQEHTPGRRPVPEVLSIELPTGQEPARSATPEDTPTDIDTGSSISSRTARKLDYEEEPTKLDHPKQETNQPHSSSSATVVKLPPIEAKGRGTIASRSDDKVSVAGANETQMTGAARQLLRQIPDLSFILKSTFCPPGSS